MGPPRRASVLGGRSRSSLTAVALSVLVVATLAGCAEQVDEPEGAVRAEEPAKRPPGPPTLTAESSGPREGASAVERAAGPDKSSESNAKRAKITPRVDLGALDGPISLTGSCGPCPRYAVTLPEDVRHDGWLDVRLHWNGTRTAGIGLAVETPNGTLLGADRGFDSFRVKVPAAAAGEYELLLAGAGDYRLEIFTRSASMPKADSAERLPNIVTMVPVQVAFGRCDSVERTEQGAQRCLRLGNAIGNTGDGPIEVHLEWLEAAQALAGEAASATTGVFRQRIYDWSGASTDRDVGSSDFHQAHGHWHYDGFARFHLYAVDLETGLRGAAAAAGHKSGFCFLDWGEMEEEETTRQSGGRAAQECLVPSTTGWSMGISAGFFDFYWSQLTDQYVEASNVKDGWYELVSVADHDDWLVELDEADNAASVLIHIQGDKVSIHEERGWYHIPAGTSQL